jgi:hypothetical protein
VSVDFASWTISMLSSLWSVESVEAVEEVFLRRRALFGLRDRSRMWAPSPDLAGRS